MADSPHASDPPEPDALTLLAAPVRRWFEQVFEQPTPAQTKAWPAIASGDNTLLLAPTGSGKTLAAFLVAISRLMFAAPSSGTAIVYVSPLKALGVDVERNLRAPLAGVRAVAQASGQPVRLPSIGVRSGDTPPSERQRMARSPPEILITTPESLYLLLTSKARATLHRVHTVIVDEIHSLVPTKRGAHLFLSLERLEYLRRQEDERAPPLQRIGLSATQRPLDEVATLLAGYGDDGDESTRSRQRSVQIIDAGRRKPLDLTIAVPVDDMARLDQEDRAHDDRVHAASDASSIWPSIHPRLVALVKQHRSTMIFVNSRRLAERLSVAINELAGEEIACAHHGSIARDTRADIEDRLKRGALPAIVATSSLELGIDMGAVDLVIQIEAPPSVASGLQRIGRAGHQVGAASRGVVFPKYRGDLLACAAAAPRMMNGLVESSRYPRNALDVLAQHIVAHVAMEERVGVDDLFSLIRGAASYHDLSRDAFEGVLDLLSGRYPSEAFSALRPRITWDRITGTLTPRQGAQRVAVSNAGTIPDRGLYGVFLMDGQGRAGTRVGELDEEMVFETRVGEVFLLGASSWQVVEITHDRVVVTPAPGQPGRMPFWRGDGPGRPYELGQAIGALARELAAMDHQRACQKLRREHCLDRRAAANLVDYITDQKAATGSVPSDRCIVVERIVDEVGDWRIMVLSPYGTRVHAPWAMAVGARLREVLSGEVDTMWSDEGMVFRVPESDCAPPLALFFPASDEIESLVVRELGQTALFATHFRENAGRALLLPKKYPGNRTPLWLQRRRSADLLSIASRFKNFPMVLESYREILSEVFDLGALQKLLRDVAARSVRVVEAELASPSPFAASLLFNYIGNFIYNGDAPLAERRAQALTLDHAQLRDLLGDAELRELLDADVIDAYALELQRLDGAYPIANEDAVHDALLRLGDLAVDELRQRIDQTAIDNGEFEYWMARLLQAQRICEVSVAGQLRLIAAEDAARYRDALGVALPRGLPDAFLQPVDDALSELTARYARTHTPFRLHDAAARFGIGVAPVRDTLRRLAAADRVVEGEFLPGGREREWCDNGVLRVLKRRSLARLRKQIEAVDAGFFARFLPHWQCLDTPRRGLDGLLDVIEQLQGAALPAAAIDTDILPARVQDYSPADLDQLCAAGEVVWRGIESIGDQDGRIALYLADKAALLAPQPRSAPGAMCARLRDLFATRGALFFEDIVVALSAFPNDVLQAIWEMVWHGEITNDTLTPLRARFQPKRASRSRRTRQRVRFRSRRVTGPPGSQGRWTPLFNSHDPSVTATARQAAIASQLLDRYGVVFREVIAAENVAGGFTGLYPVLKAMEDAGRVRRGYFIAGQGAAQFALPGAEDRLRERGQPDECGQCFVLAATDPANAYGASIPWPPAAGTGARAQRAAGARVVLHDGRLLAWLGRSSESMLTFIDPDQPERGHQIDALASCLAATASPVRPLNLTKIDGEVASNSFLARALIDAGFKPNSGGLLHRGASGKRLRDT